MKKIAVLLVLIASYLCFAKKVAEAPTYTATPIVRVTVTAYSPTVGECDDDPFITAFNKKVKAGTIAISRDLERVHGWEKGDLIHLEGLGVFEVWDRMNKRFTQRVDVFFFQTRKAKKFGRIQAKAEKL